MSIKESDVAQHNLRSSAWIIIEDNVYDVTEYLLLHPGGDRLLLEVAGRDVTGIEISSRGIFTISQKRSSFQV
jgi:cytochrome b involved in lipid metabolism